MAAKSEKESISMWSIFDSIMEKEKFAKFKVNGFEIDSIEVKKSYPQKKIDLSFDLLYTVDGSWGLFKHFDCSYNELNVKTLQDDIKGLKQQCKSTKDFHSKLKRPTVRTGKYKSAGWSIFYNS